MYQPKRLRIGDPQGKMPPLRTESARVAPLDLWVCSDTRKSNAAKNIKQAHKARRIARQNAVEPVADIAAADLPPPRDSLVGARRQKPHSFVNVAPHKITPPRVSATEFRAMVAQPQSRAAVPADEFKAATPVNRRSPPPILPRDYRR
jgi:hypothetical protein